MMNCFRWKSSGAWHGAPRWRSSLVVLAVVAAAWLGLGLGAPAAGQLAPFFFSQLADP